MFICLFADVPGELIFGSLVDASCTLWSSGGSCSSYNTTNLRIGLFGVAAMARYPTIPANRDVINTFAFCSGLAAVFDGLVWHGVKGLKIY